ncbi:MAG: hypothetical protein FGM15_06140 [Chthoniobacterales bacterium]|nr:hypothetical protein [Chthoniobacterales bacterium]
MKNQTLRFIGYGIAAVLLLATVAPAEDQPNASAPRDGLLLEYLFEGDAGDTSGNNRQGELRGQPKFAGGRHGKCLNLDGRADYADSKLPSTDLGDTFTVECWVKPDAQQNPHANIFGNHAHGGLGFVLQQDGANSNRFIASYGAGADRWIATPPVQLAAGKWQHVALVKTPESLSFFHNGVEVASVPASAPMAASPTTLRVGLGFDRPNDGAYVRCFRGSIDEFRVWNKAVTDFNLTLSPEERVMPLVARLDLKWQRVAGADGRSRWEFALPSLVAGKLPQGVSGVEVAIAATPWDGGLPIEMPAVAIAESAGFKAVVDPGLPPGAYTVSARSRFVTDAGRVPGEARVFNWISSPPPAVLKEGNPEMKGRESLALTLSQTLSLDGPDWKIAVDPKNEGREKKWFDAPPADTRPTKVPWVIQDIFPGYHGVAWYWREFDAPANPHRGGRSLIRFEAVDYLAEVWVNGRKVGSHEGGETPFQLDVTDALRPGAKNLLAVRVLNPTHDPIDGIRLKQTPSGVKNTPITGNMSFNSGGIVDSVSLVLNPAASIKDVFVLPDWKTGRVQLRLDINNTQPAAAESVARITITDARSGAVVSQGAYPLAPAPGISRHEAALEVPNHRLWELADPALYRATVDLADAKGLSGDQHSVRFGFRDFRFENGYFRLNGKRILLKGPGYLAHFPAGYTVPLDEDMLRRDVVNMKALGCNFVRLAFGGVPARMLDIFDEIGLLVHQEHFGSWQLEPSPLMLSHWERSLGQVVLRDRNHPSVVEWGLLNETMGGPLHDHAAESIPFLHELDSTRVLSINSGGSVRGVTLSNPGSETWDVGVRDLLSLHLYVRVPFPREQLDVLRTGNHPERVWGIYSELIKEPTPNAGIYIGEYGQSGSLNLPDIVARYERAGHSTSDEARYFQKQLALFLADWKGWNLSDTWPRTEDFFDDANREFAEIRKTGETAVRSNPRVVAYTPSHLVADSTYNASGATDLFREMKPYVPDTYLLANAPLRWCLFADPVSIYRGGRVRLDASIANEDRLPPGKYPARLQVIGPDGKAVFDKTVEVRIPPATGGKEPPFAQAVLSEEIVIDGPPGEYRFVASLAQGGMGRGGNIGFHVTDPAAMPGLPSSVVLWGEDPAVAKWLTDHGVKVLPFDPANQTKRHVIVAAGKPPAPGGAAAFRDLAAQMARGSSVVFLDPAVFANTAGADTATLAEQYKVTQVVGTRWLPLARKGTVTEADWVGGYYRGARWAKRHPIFDGLPGGGMMDARFYANIISPLILAQDYTVYGGGVLMNPATAPLDRPAEAVCGSIRTNSEYVSGLHVGVWNFGAGRFIVNTLRIRENLGPDPAAERLLRNMLTYAARGTDQPAAELPADFQQQLKAIGYE